MHYGESASIALPLETARNLAIVKQGLHQRPPVVNKVTLLNIIRQIGLLQLDSINVVARSHYLVMLSRVGLYVPADLDALLYPDRHLFEQWAHAACLIPADDYEYFAPVILARRECSYRSPHRRLRQLEGYDKEILNTVLSEVRKRGPLASEDFEDPRSNPGTWFEWKPAKVALEALFEKGYLMIDRRVNFRRYYDLSERVLPLSSELPSKSLDDWLRWVTLRSIACLGIATVDQISDYYRQRKPAVRAMIQVLVEEGTIVPVEVEGWKEKAFLHSGDLRIIEEIETGKHKPTLTIFLSPFDNLLWHRSRVLDLFNFSYSAEMYTPLAKQQRKYGYYVLPILHQGRLVGRLDPKADRRTRTMIVNAIYLESGEALTDVLLKEVAGALHEFMSFHDCQTLVIECSEPRVLKAALLDKIKNEA